MQDTIFALATAQGRGAVAIVRVSGPKAGSMLAALAGLVPKPRLATLRRLRGRSGDVIDQALVLWFPGPGSLTGEDLFELQVHGGRAVVELLMRTLSELGGRLAEPGEFTRRAFQAEKLDLAQAEAVADLVDAETDAQRRQALGQLGGALGRRTGRWRDRLLTVLALLEAEIDFPDEDIPASVAEASRQGLLELRLELVSALEERRGEIIRGGMRIALIGAPNAGKSSLLNALCGRDAAIVTATAGTTRDVIEVEIRLGGHKAVLADTAGLRETEDEAEREGVRRARRWAREADLRLCIVDPEAVESAGGDFEALMTPHDWVIFSKADLSAVVDRQPPGFETWASLRTSVLQPSGVDALKARLEAWAREAMAGADFPAVTQARHRTLLEECLGHVDRALSHWDMGAEVRAEDVRLGARSLERLTGRIDAEDVLDRVFSSFCIGK